MSLLPLIDSFGRVHSNLRISVTDRCNIRCVYCMPSENVTFRPRAELLTFEEIVRFTAVAARLGVNKIRLTGGEPLVRSGLPKLIRALSTIDGISDIALTTNGLLLPQCAVELKDAGLHRLNISIDTLHDDVFFKISRRRGINKVIDGILISKKLGFRKIRLNTVIIPQINAGEIEGLARFAREHQLELRFIEFMPLNASGHWEMDEVLTGEAIRAVIERQIGSLRPVVDGDPHQPARDYEYLDGGGRVGFVDSVTEPFCASCNRIRLTADGHVHHCLFSDAAWDVRALLRDPRVDDAAIAELIGDCVRAKWAGHGIRTIDFVKPRRAMNEIGG